MKSSPAKKTAFVGLLFALAVVLSYLESLIPPVPGLPPGIKLGLSNIVTMFGIFFLSPAAVVSLVVLKALFAMLTRGVTAGLMSLCGGILSFIIMYITVILSRKRVSCFFVSILGAVFHNTGQLLFAVWWIGSAVIYYLPVLVLSGIAMGAVTGIALKTLLPAVSKVYGIERKKGEDRG